MGPPQLSMRDHSSGYTLVELSVVMALVSIIMLASVAGAMALIDQHRINQLAEQNAEAIKRVEAAYGEQPNYTGLSLRQAVSYGAFRPFIISQSGTNNVTVTHPYGGAVGVAALGGVAPLAWGLYLNAIPAKLCTDLLLQSAPAVDALIVYPGGMNNPTGWAGDVVLDGSVPRIIPGPGFDATAPVIAKNLTVAMSPTALSDACHFAGTSFGVLLLKSKLK